MSNKTKINVDKYNQHVVLLEYKKEYVLLASLERPFNT